MYTHIKISLLMGLLFGGIYPAYGGGLALLDQFLRTTQSGTTQFSQTVSGPSKTGIDGKSTQKIRRSSGTFSFQRPQFFVFTYAPPSDQLILADGQYLWSVDLGLGQATSRPQATTLATTPAALIATATGIAQLSKQFDLKDMPSPATGTQWVFATPKSEHSGIVRFQIGLLQTKEGIEVVELEILDAFGQTSNLRFSQFRINPSLDRSMFRLQLPAGVVVNRL